jgi:protein-S-isoprenylcysteine O-methyltransferase Ste14
MSRRLALIASLAFLVLAPGTVVLLVPWWLTRWRMGPPLLGLGASRMAGAALCLAAAAALLDSFARFALRGRGTPAPILPARHLVVSGLYRHVRNPMYIAVVSAIVGQGLFLGDPRVVAYGLVLWAVFHAFVKAYEEPTLRRTFGAEYEAFTASVPRWVPRVRPWRGRPADGAGRGRPEAPAAR